MFRKKATDSLLIAWPFENFQLLSLMVTDLWFLASTGGLAIESGY